MIIILQEELIRQSSVKIHLSDCLELSTHEIYSRMTNMIQSYSAEEVHLDACYAIADLIGELLIFMYCSE